MSGEPETLVECATCGGDGAVLKTIHVYETGCGFSHPDVASEVCSDCGGAPLSVEPVKSDRKIVTKYDPPPIPWREADWSAVFDDYDLGSPIGHGLTEQDAIDDLLAEAEGDS